MQPDSGRDMPREPECLEDFMWKALFDAAEHMAPDKGRAIIGTMKHTQQRTWSAVYDALRAAEKADVPHQFLWGCAKRKKTNGSVKRPRPVWCVSEDALWYYGRMDKSGGMRRLGKVESK